MFSIKKSVKNGQDYYYLQFSYHGRRRIIHSLGKNIPPDSFQLLKNTIGSINQCSQIDPAAEVPLKQGGELLCLGQIFIKMAFQDLGLHSFFKQENRNSNAFHSFCDLYYSLVSARILAPGSILGEYVEKDIFFEHFSLPESSIYRYLDYFSRMDDEIQETLYFHAPPHFRCVQDQKLDYDGTNIFTFASKPDEDRIIDAVNGIVEKGLRKLGFSKENRPVPIVQIGLFASENGYPVAWNIFSGNEKEVSHIIPVLERMKKDYGLEYYTFEADRANGSGKVIAYIQRVDLENRKKEYTEKDDSDYYIIGKSIRQASDSLKEFALEPGGFEDVKVVGLNHQVRQYRIKSRIFQQPVKYLNSQGKQTSTRVVQVQIVYHSETYARREEHKRTERIEKSAKLAEQPSKANEALNKGDLRYLDTGNLDFSRLDLGIDVEKVKQEKRFDGYYVVLSNIVERAAGLLYALYKELHFNEEDFRILKSFLQIRPVYVQTPEHIKAHVTVCITSLAILRYLQYKLKNRFTIPAIIAGLKDFYCVKEEHWYRVLYKNEVIAALEEATGVKIEHQYQSYNDLKKLFSWKNLSPQLKLF